MISGMIPSMKRQMKHLSCVPLAVAVTGLCAGLGCAPLATPTEPAGSSPAADLDLWSWCPAPEPTTRIEEDKLWLQFTSDARYCSVTPPGTWDTDTRVEIWDTLALQMQLQLVPSDMFLPREPGSYEVRAPLCARRAGVEGLSPSGSARLIVEDEGQLGQDRTRYTLEQPLLHEDGAPFTFRMQWAGFDWALASGLQLSGEPWPAGTDPNVAMFLCEGTSCDLTVDPNSEEERPGMIRWDACRFADGGTESYRIEFDGGELFIDIENIGNPYQPRNAIVGARGELLGQAFAQQSFWRLAMRESYPYSYSRDIAIVLDEPVGNVCGVEIRELYLGGSVQQLTLRGCDGSNDDLRTVFVVEWTHEEPTEEDG